MKAGVFKTVPILPTIVVALAALLMVRLGFWQLSRLHEKEALLARYTVNQAKPALPFVALFPVTDDALFRRTSVTCLQATNWQAAAGRAADGSPGWRHMAACRTGAEGPGVLVDVGISTDSRAPAWNGGRIQGRLTWAPSSQPLLMRLFGTAPAPTPMIVSDVAAPGLRPTIQPDPSDIPNNHLSYAVQWFLFAGVALLIYGIALWQRARKPRSG